MTKKKKISFTEQLGHAVSDVANAASVAATGSEFGVLELAAEDELNPPARKRPRKKKTARRKKKATPRKAAPKKTARKKTIRPTKKKRAAKRR